MGTKNHRIIELKKSLFEVIDLYVKVRQIVMLGLTPTIESEPPQTAEPPDCLAGDHHDTVGTMHK